MRERLRSALFIARADLSFMLRQRETLLWVFAMPRGAAGSQRTKQGPHGRLLRRTGAALAPRAFTAQCGVQEL